VLGEGFTWETQNLARDRETAQRGWTVVRAMLRDSSLGLVVLDELTYVLKNGWLDLPLVLADLGRPPAAAARGDHRPRRAARTVRRGRHGQRAARRQARLSAPACARRKGSICERCAGVPGAVRLPRLPPARARRPSPRLSQRIIIVGRGGACASSRPAPISSIR
jgi:hypothetical protein